MFSTSHLRPTGMNDATDRDGFATHSFPPNGLVALSRIAYESTPLLTEIRAARDRPASEFIPHAAKFAMARGY